MKYGDPDRGIKCSRLWLLVLCLMKSNQCINWPLYPKYLVLWLSSWQIFKLLDKRSGDSMKCSGIRIGVRRTGWIRGIFYVILLTTANIKSCIMQGLTKADEIYMLSYRMKRLKEILQLILRTIKLMGITYTFMHIHNGATKVSCIFLYRI